MRGKLTASLKGKRDGITKALPYGLTCGILFHCTGIFDMRSKVSIDAGFFPRRCDIRGILI